MFQKFIDDFRQSTGNAMHLTSLAIVVGVLLFITTGFLCAAAFIFVQEKYGLLQACFAGAGVFFIAALFATICYVVRKRQIAQERAKAAAEASKSTMQAALSDPMVLAAGIQIIRTIGLKRIIPLVAVAGIAFGLMASRRSAEAADDEPAD
ncbi:hypothetical protein BH10PSE10_BH10PSE10_05340 [soil metagenome]